MSSKIRNLEERVNGCTCPLKFQQMMVIVYVGAELLVFYGIIVPKLHQYLIEELETNNHGGFWSMVMIYSILAVTTLFIGTVATLANPTSRAVQA